MARPATMLLLVSPLEVCPCSYLCIRERVLQLTFVVLLFAATNSSSQSAFSSSPRLHDSTSEMGTLTRPARTSQNSMVSARTRVVRDMMLDLEEKLAEEDTKTGLLEVFKGKRMMYRILLGVGIQAFQQLTGANYFFYYGTTIFSSIGIDN